MFVAEWEREEIRFIRLVQLYSELYDLSHPNKPQLPTQKPTLK